MTKAATAVEWIRPTHVPAEPLSELERETWDILTTIADSEARHAKRRARQGARLNVRDDEPRQADQFCRAACSFYIPGKNAIQKTDAEKTSDAMAAAMKEIMHPEGVGLKLAGGGGAKGLLLNVLRTAVKRKLKREGRMTGGKWRGDGKGKPRGKWAPGHARRMRAAVGIAIALLTLLAISSPMFPGTR